MPCDAVLNIVTPLRDHQLMLLRRNLVLCRNSTPESCAHTCCVYPMALQPLDYYTSPWCSGTVIETLDPPLKFHSAQGQFPAPLVLLSIQWLPVNSYKALPRTAQVNHVVSQCCCFLRNSLTHTSLPWSTGDELLLYRSSHWACSAHLE